MYSDSAIYNNLPDPECQYAFYDGVVVKRGLAWLIDLVVIMALVVPVVVLTAFIGIFFLPVLFVIVGFIYRVWTIGSGSATWGMRLMAIELRDMYGHRLDTGQAFLHTLGYSISISFVFLQILSIILMFTSPRGQGLTDMVLGTVMLNRRV